MEALERFERAKRRREECQAVVAEMLARPETNSDELNAFVRGLVLLVARERALAAELEEAQA